MKQKLFSFFLAIIGLVVGGTLEVLAGTETPGNTGTSNTAVTGLSYSIDGAYVAGTGGVQQGNMASKGIKLRSNQSNKLVITVNAGYVINSATLHFASNTTYTRTITSVSVDGNTVDGISNVVIPANNASTSADISLSSIDAEDNITINFATDETQTQIVGDFSFTYTQAEVVTQEISAVTLNGTALSAENLATLKADKSVTIDGSSLNGFGLLEVSLTSGSTTVSRSISGTTATYTFVINNSDNYTVTVQNLNSTFTKIGSVIAYKEGTTNATGQNTASLSLNGITFDMVNTSKTFQYGSGSVTLGGKEYQPIKLSTGSAVNITFPENTYATKVRVYGWSLNGNGKLNSFSETSASGAKSVNVSNDLYYATNTSSDVVPSVYEYELDNWTSAYFNPGGSPSQPFVVMDFVLEKPKYSLAVSSNNTSYGTVANNAEDATAVEVGTSVTVTATAAEGYRFTGWTNSNGALVSGDNPYTFVMPNENYSLTANFAVRTSVPDVAYLYNSTYTNYCGLANDPVYKALQENDGEAYNLTAVDVNSYATAETTTDDFKTAMSEYKLVISTEANAGNNSYGVALKDLVGTIPMINLKTFYYNSGRWGWGSGANPSASDAQLTVTNKNLKLFEGVLFNGNNAEVFSNYTSSKNLLQGTVLGEGITDATVLATVGDNTAIFSRGDDFVSIGYSYDELTSVNGNGIRIIKNAIDILLDDELTFASTAEAPMVATLTIDGTQATAKQLGELSNGTVSETLDYWPSSLPQVAATATNGSVEIVQGTPSSPTTSVILKNTEGATYATYKYEYEVESEQITLVYTSSGYNSDTKTWSDGTYSLSSNSGVDGNSGSCFKLANRTYILKMPANIKIDKVGYTGYDYNGNYTGDAEGTVSGATITIGSTALTGWKGYKESYNSAENITKVESITHSAGNDVELVVTNAGQLIGSLILYVSEQNPGAAPTLNSSSNTTSRNGSITLYFSAEMQDASATLNGETVTAEGGASTVTFYYWGLEYGSNAVFTIPANTLQDKYGNVYTEAVNINFTVDSKPVLTKKKFDVIVGTEGNEDLQTVLDNYKNYSGSERKYIFIPDGTYKLTGNSSFTTKDNGSGSSWIWNEETGTLTEGTYTASTTYTDNAMTQLRSSNLSIIGQSMDKTILYNIPYIPGISYTSTLEIRSGSDNYLQDFTLKNMYAGGRHDKGVAVAFYDRGTRTIAKNLNCWSNQDTYVSNGARNYYETSKFAGTVDFICGNGDVWFQECELIINDRSGNVIAAPRTEATEKWGYVFYQNTISLAEGATSAKDGNWNLGRPWDNSPAATYLYTTMNTTPKTAAWTNMSDSKVIRFHEYGSVNASGNTIDLSGRSISECNPADGSDNPVLTTEQAAKYTLHNVLGGTDGWDPSEYTAQVSVENISLSGNTLSWSDNDDALCWMIFKDGVYYDNVITTSVTLAENGNYTVRAANAHGGLGEASASVEYSAPLILTTTVNMAGYKSFYDADKSYTLDAETKAYVAIQMKDDVIGLRQISNVPAGTPVVLKTTGEAAEPTSAAYYQMTLTPTEALVAEYTGDNLLAVTAGAGEDLNVLRLGYNAEEGVAFYKWTVENNTTAGIVYLNLSAENAAKMAFVFEEEEEADGIADVVEDVTSDDAAVYNLAGQRVKNGAKGIIIKGGKKFVNK